MPTNRRSFLRNASLGMLGLAAGERLGRLVPGLGSGVAHAAGEKAVVVINLFGGNDGLNTVVPLGQYDRYRQMRPTLAYDRDELVALPGQPDFALNPGLGALAPLYSQGKLAILNGVGVPPSATGLFDHAAQQFEFQSCDIVRAGGPGAPTGWLGRYLDAHVGGDVAPGIDMGGGRLMVTGNACDPLTVNTIEDLALRISFDEQARHDAYAAVQASPSANPVAERHRQVRLQALAQSDRILAAVSGYSPAASYPAESTLGFNLQQCAKILWGELGVRGLCVGLGSFDTHADQDEGRAGDSLGYHAGLLKDLADSVAAFQADLEAHGLADRVLILTVSEFGRTPFENGTAGSDHGFGSVAFAIGNSVNGGVYGTYPGLGDDDLVFDGNVDVTTDFRSVYATAVANFLAADPVPAVGGSFPLLGYV